MDLFYEMEDDVAFKGRWFLNGLYDQEGTELDGRYFTVGKRVPQKLKSMPTWVEGESANVTLPFMIPLRKAGRIMDITFADFQLPICKRDISSLLMKHFSDELQIFPATVDNKVDEFVILNVASCVDCIDVDKSDLDLWEDDNPIRPDLAGTPMMIEKLLVDPGRIGEHNIFRLRGWDDTIVVSERVKRLLEKKSITGVRFINVSQ